MNLTYEEQLESKEWQENRERILKRDGHKCSMCESTKHLNVHHKYYILGHLAWEYEDETFVTLCQKCHERIHKVSNIVAYKDDRKTIVNTQLTPCYRCGGTGYFPEYKHIQYGICFRCKGACFEEFMEESSKKEYEVIKSTKEEWGLEDDYDCEPRGYDEEYEKKIFENALKRKRLEQISHDFIDGQPLTLSRYKYAQENEEFDDAGVLYDVENKTLIASYLHDNNLYYTEERLENINKSFYMIKEGTKVIGKRAFTDYFYVGEWDDVLNCFGFDHIVIPDSVHEIEEHAFNSVIIRVLQLSESLKNIGDYAFSSTSIESFTLPSSVRYIGESIFANCERLSEIKVSPLNKFYDSRNNCNAIINTLSNSIIASCSSTIIPEGVEGIDAGAFESVCMNNLVVPKSVAWIDYNAFKDCKIAKLFLPNTIKEIHENWYDYDESEENEIHMSLSLFLNHLESFVKLYNIIKIDDVEVEINVVSLDEFIQKTSTNHTKVFDNGRILFTGNNNFRFYARFSTNTPKDERNESYLLEKRQSLTLVMISGQNWDKSFITKY